MPHPEAEQSGAGQAVAWRIGVDVGGTFTDLVAFDGRTLHVVKLPSTPPDFHEAVIEAVRRVLAPALEPPFFPSPGNPGEGQGEGSSLSFPDNFQKPPDPHPSPLPEYRERGQEAGHGGGIGGGTSPSASIVHGSTVATNALLQRAGEPVAFVTTEGFRDMLLIGRQNRPDLYALRIVRPRPLTSPENWLAVRERIGSHGEVVVPLEEAEVDRLVESIRARGLRHVAVCLLFGFVNPAHERLIGERCRRAGMTVSLSSDVLPEFREYERASTTVMNATLRPTVEAYLGALADGLAGATPASPGPHDRTCPLGAATGDAGVAPTENPHPQARATQASPLRVMHSGGGTLSVAEAGASAARLVLSGPAGGVIGAAFVAAAAGFKDVITYDMGGTSTDVAVIVDGQPQWSTGGTVDGLPLALPAFDIVTVGAGGGSVARLDAGGALRVGPRSAGAVPGPACYNRGGTEPTVTDANLLLGRLLPDVFAGGTMRVEPDLARRAVEPLARAMGKSVEEAALGIVRVAEQNMSRAVRAVTSRRGLDPRDFTLVSFGGAGGLHACAVAESLDIPRVLIPPYCGVLSALGMVVAPPVADASRTVLHLGEGLDDARLAAEFGYLNLHASETLPAEQLASVEAYADCRFRGQSYEVKVRCTRPARETIEAAFGEAYRKLYGQVPQGRPVEIVTLRIRRIGHVPRMALPRLVPQAADRSKVIRFTDATGQASKALRALRAHLLNRSEGGPLLLVDSEATTFVPSGWVASGREDGTVELHRPRDG